MLLHILSELGVRKRDPACPATAFLFPFSISEPQESSQNNEKPRREHFFRCSWAMPAQRLLEKHNILSELDPSFCAKSLYSLGFEEEQLLPSLPGTD